MFRPMRRLCCAAGKTVSAKEKGLKPVQPEYETVDYVNIDMRPPLSEDKFELDLERARRRLMYQSGKRGMLEMDALLGTFGRARIPEWSRTQLMQWHDILRHYDNDLYCWLVRRTKLEEVPSDLTNSQVYQDLVMYSQNEEHRTEIPE
eukprot:TRINITY_DN37610_c0_g1_i1.p1 TRINITY_DN37610_c0_g1~~TRINITY_DN37610_c0_g1_i1.p1  ORF type:complete len:167 (+),score=37.50 TRINITY_DN37610_c0_g1_i1:60-503(+)